MASFFARFIGEDVARVALPKIATQVAAKDIGSIATADAARVVEKDAAVSAPRIFGSSITAMGTASTLGKLSLGYTGYEFISSAGKSFFGDIGNGLKNSPIGQALDNASGGLSSIGSDIKGGLEEGGTDAVAVVGIIVGGIFLYYAFSGKRK